MKLNLILTILVAALPVSTIAAEGWTPGYYSISKIDSLTINNRVYLTLDNYENSACSDNRILLAVNDDRKFDQMYSLVLSAFHAGAKVKFYFPSTANCDSTRIQMIK